MSLPDLSGKHEVIIIGGGIGGLTCAAWLASLGHRVLVLEQHHKPGGYATCFSRKAMGKDTVFRFDASIHTIGGCGPDGVLTRVLRQIGAAQYVDFIKIKNKILTGIYPDRTLAFPTDRSEFLELLQREFPLEVKGLCRLFELMESLVAFFFRWKDSGGPRARLSLLLDPAFLRLFPRARRSLKQEMDRHLRDPRLKFILASLIGWAGLMPHEFDFLTFAITLVGILREEGSYYIRGGSQQLSNALARAVTEHGGHIRYKARVSRILVNGRTVAGVELASGERLRSDIVVSNASAHQTLTELLPPEALPTGYRRRIMGLRPSTSAFVVYLGLDAAFQPPEALEGEFDLLYAKTYYPRRAALTLQDTGDLPYLGISNYTVIDSSLAPAGSKVVTLMVPMDMGDIRDWGLASMEERNETYASIKASLANRLVQTAEKVYPNLGRHILVQETATPVTLYRYTLNTAGSFLGYQYRVGHWLFDRPGPRTPVQGLYLTGAWTRPGGGIQGVTVSGMIVAELVHQALS